MLILRRLGIAAQIVVSFHFPDNRYQVHVSHRCLSRLFGPELLEFDVEVKEGQEDFDI